MDKRQKVKLYTRVEPGVKRGLESLAEKKGMKLYQYLQKLITRHWDKKCNQI